MSRTYKVGWGEEWPQLTVEVPDDAELALFDATYEPHVTDPGILPGFPIRTARTLNVKLVFIDLEPEVALREVGAMVHPSRRPYSIVKEEEKP
jgi:hypothetical protein